MELNNYTPEEQDALLAISASMASVEKLETLALRIPDPETLAGNIAAVRQELATIEEHMAYCAGLRKVKMDV